MTNKMYDTIKGIALLLVPTCTLIMTLLQIFGIIDNEKGILVSSAIDTFLGAIVVVAKQLYDEKHKKNNKSTLKKSKTS